MLPMGPMRALLLLLLAPSLALAVERGPVVMPTAPDRVTLTWRGPDARRLVLIGPGGERSIEPPAPDARGRVVLPLDGLKPATRYRYRIDTPMGPVEGRFHTPPPAGAPFTFVAYGDSRLDHRVHAGLAGHIAATDPDLALHTGDLVTRGARDHEWGAFFDAARPVLRRAAFAPVLGNHDLDGSDPAPLLAHFALPDDRPYFAFTWGHVRFLMLDSEVHVTDGEGAPDAAQQAWIRDALKAAGQDPAIAHVVAVVHKGPYSGHPGRSGNLGLRALLPELRALGLSLVISGHDHYYERGVDASGLPYLVLGGGGAPLYATRGPGARDGYTARVSRPIYSFARLRALPDRLDGCGVDLSGVPFDCFSLPTRPTAP